MHYVRCLGLILLALVSSACAHKGAIKVDCDGPLEPINRPISADQAPVSVEPESDTSNQARQP